jgi:hypothetical protein
VIRYAVFSFTLSGVPANVAPIFHSRVIINVNENIHGGSRSFALMRLKVTRPIRASPLRSRLSLEAFLMQGLELAKQEPTTPVRFALRIGPSTGFASKGTSRLSLVFIGLSLFIG